MTHPLPAGPGHEVRSERRLYGLKERPAKANHRVQRRPFAFVEPGSEDASLDRKERALADPEQEAGSHRPVQTSEVSPGQPTRSSIQRPPKTAHDGSA